MFTLTSQQSQALRARVMFTEAFTSSSARLGLLTVASYKKFLAVDASVVFGDVKASISASFSEFSFTYHLT